MKTFKVLLTSEEKSTVEATHFFCSPGFIEFMRHDPVQKKFYVYLALAAETVRCVKEIANAALCKTEGQAATIAPLQTTLGSGSTRRVSHRGTHPSSMAAMPARVLQET